jgi:hypothetical protein
LNTLPALLLAAAVVLAGCGGDDDSGASDKPSEPSKTVETSSFMDVAGDYDTAVELLASTCEGIEVADNVTTVKQKDDAVTLVHGEVSYAGAMREDGTFGTAATAVTVGGDTHELAVAGTFSDDGFEAQVTAAVTGSQTCAYTVSWTGTRK